MSKVSFIFALLANLIVPSIGFAQTTKPAAAPAAADEDEDVVYRPPSQGASRARMGGGSRAGVKLPTIEALVPDHAGRTLAAKPVLYWFCSEPTNLKAEFSLVDATTLDTVKRVPVPSPTQAGWQKIDLNDLGIELAPDTPYDWRVAILAGTGKNSDNAVAGGTIDRIAPDHTLAAAAAEMHNAAPIQRAVFFAASGVWYDAIAAIMTELERDPANAAAKKALAGLLSQVKLKGSSEFAAK
jgi:hypothetical protein